MHSAASSPLHDLAALLGVRVTWQGWIVGVAAATLAALMLLMVAARRRHSLQSQLSQAGSDWAALTRVTAGGEALGAPTSSAAGGPRGVLRLDGDLMTWEPDRWEKRRGYATTRWRTEDLTVLSRRERRDITGARFVELLLETPTGRLTLAIFGEVGARPRLLSDRA